ncbi:atypical/ABC1/ABC1-B protein kinase [Spizellomyces punctatus DAOM BR117]|uniref:Atypical/ABC1/ABC1-B protein kinase n=1 Tax=Spizellomyces punctatus (strain DAOM BR117) TaxID=645134 RepID=A0A0L0HIQ1_SPIPD|nr:atypical/ABC1/ABC1-B protein kinase [Spizellomyces punctatus DAOM BR117]KND00699.1 atypical/ABC1/ABC1-B protein kinase [Spizellomyces punctatus DAOM BR117]|eukprot:XP_016608738.1 atypical/ABC1/ABC1-B protein kinase [Spizellomyces punctatus DAOM BR117]
MLAVRQITRACCFGERSFSLSIGPRQRPAWFTNNFSYQQPYSRPSAHIRAARVNTASNPIFQKSAWKWWRARRIPPSLVSTNQHPRRAIRGKVLLTFIAFAGGTVGGFYLYDPANFNHNRLALVRSYRTAVTAALIAIDYKWSLRKGPDLIGAEEYERVKSACHKRAANRMLELCKTNQGIYIKLGQHIAAMVFLLPPEYTETMRPLQDRCPPTPFSDVEALFQSDVGYSISEMFSFFDPTPLGVASLAQVHRARLLTGEEVAVKVQHPYLDEYTPVDISTTAFLVRLVKKIFPEFEFEWLAEEMQQSLPQELDFVHEANNAERVRSLFAGNAILKIPKVYWAARRLLIMEFADGGKIDDLHYLNANGISPQEVSAQLSRIYYEMIFLHGFVHCDPHPGNIFVRPRPRPWLSRIPFLGSLVTRNPYNFEIVLLDHGLYRQLPDEFRLDYAHLWTSILAGDEPGILMYSYRLFTHDKESRSKRASEDGIDHHRLFASMLTGRSWEVISDANKSGMGIAQARTTHEFQVIRQKAASGRFFLAIADILSKLPRELLLLLKTNDLLRAVDESLGVSGSSASDHMLRTVATMGWYCALAIKRETIRQMVKERIEQGKLRPVWTEPRFWRSLWDFWGVGLKVWLLEWFVWGRTIWKWASRSPKGTGFENPHVVFA